MATATDTEIQSAIMCPWIDPGQPEIQRWPFLARRCGLSRHDGWTIWAVHRWEVGPEREDATTWLLFTVDVPMQRDESAGMIESLLEALEQLDEARQNRMREANPVLDDRDPFRDE